MDRLYFALLLKMATAFRATILSYLARLIIFFSFLEFTFVPRCLSGDYRPRMSHNVSAPASLVCLQFVFLIKAGNLNARIFFAWHGSE